MNEISLKLEKSIQLLFRFLLCMSAYIPMFIMLVLKNIKDMYLCIVLISIFIVLPLIVVRMYISNPLKREANHPIVLTSINRKESEIMNYISGYIISLISFNSDVFTETGIDIPNLLGITLLFLVICSLYMKAHMYDVNPVLSLFYDILDVTDSNGKNATLLVDRKLETKPNKRMIVRVISPGIYLHTSSRKNKISIFKIILLIFTMLLLLFIWNEDFKRIVLEKLLFLSVLIKK